jgi:hypothetical protein
MRLIITIVVLVVIVALVHYFLYGKKVPIVTPVNSVPLKPVADNLPLHYTPIPTSQDPPRDILDSSVSDLANISDAGIAQLLTMFN